MNIMIYSEKLKELREENNLTQEKTRQIINVSKQAYNHFEKEYTIIPMKHLITLCNYFNVSIDYIFNFTNTRNYKDSNNTIDLKVISERLKEFRKESNLTQEKLAEQLNIVKGTIGNYESSRSLIATPFLYTICKKYQISADYLLGKIDKPKYLK